MINNDGIGTSRIAPSKTEKLQVQNMMVDAQSIEPTAGSLPERPLVPTSPGDWESKKRIIRELYMDQNMILNEVMEIMVTKHKFKAT